MNKSLVDLITKTPPSVTDPDLDIDSDTLKQQTKLADLKNKRYASDTMDRRWLSAWSAGVVSVWLACVLYILANNNAKFHLSDSVLNILLGTTTLNVLGLSFIVLRGHFGYKKES